MSDVPVILHAEPSTPVERGRGWPILHEAWFAVPLIAVGLASLAGMAVLWAPCFGGAPAACSEAVYVTDYSWLNIAALVVLALGVAGVIFTRTWEVFIAVAVVGPMALLFDPGFFPQWGTADPSPGHGLVPAALWAAAGFTALALARRRRR